MAARKTTTRKKTKRKGLFDVFRDALESVEQVQKQQVEKKAALPKPATRKPGKSILNDISQKSDKTERYQTMDQNREERQRSFDKYLKNVNDERDVSVDAQNQETIEAFIATHEESTEVMRGQFEQELLRARDRFDAKLQKITAKHNKHLRKMVEAANAGSTIRISEKQLAGPIRGGAIRLPNRGRVMIRTGKRGRG